MAQASVSSEHAESATHVAPLALSALALTTFFLGASHAHLFTTAGIIGLVFFFGGLVQLLVGLWEYRSGNTVHATAFVSYGGFWLAYGAMLQNGAHANSTELGYFFLAWTIFAGITFLSTMRTSFVQMGVFLCFFLTLLALTIGVFGAIAAFITIGGWLGIITAILAWYSVLASMGAPFSLPTGHMS
jgi:succinate-acetate transporter protein